MAIIRIFNKKSELWTLGWALLIAAIFLTPVSESVGGFLHSVFQGFNSKEGLNNWFLLVMFQAFSVIAV